MPTSTTSSSESSQRNSDSFLYGDTNCDKVVDVSDAVLLARFVAEDSEAQVSAQGKKNSDCDGKTGLTGDDTVRILQYIAKLVTADQMGKAL